MPEASRLRRWVEKGWYAERGHFWLLPFPILHELAVILRNAAYRWGIFRSFHPGVPVIVVGNITVGGTGKTPLVIWLARQLMAEGRRVGVALRGYGGQVREPTLLTPASEPRMVGDEAVLIAARTGCVVAVGAARAAVAALLVRQGCDLVLCDDGLQHLALKRDVEIVVIDAARGFGNGKLLPLGPLRERQSRLLRAAAVVLNGSGEIKLPPGTAPPLRMDIRPESLVALAGGNMESLDCLRGASIHAVAGIGHPQRFFALLRSLGATPVEHAFADHHPFVPAELQFGDERRIVMTEKDAVKCRAFASEHMWMLPVSATLAASDAARLLDLVRGRGPTVNGVDERA